MTPLDESPYSRHFIALTSVGAWILSDRTPSKVILYAIFKVVMTVIAGYGSYMLLEDLVLVLGDFKKLTWNLCISTLFIGALTKNFFCLNQSHYIEKLRRHLHRSAELRDPVEYGFLHNSALKSLKYLEVSMYIGGAISVPFWLVTQYLSYLWGPKEWPIPFRLPFEVDMEDDMQYSLIFAVIGTAAIAGLYMVMEQELAMFTLLIQISREYQVLLQDIQKLNELYDDSDLSLYEQFRVLNSKRPSGEINPVLRKVKTKMLIKQFSTRQQELIQYTEWFEIGYNYAMLLQFFGTGLIIVFSLIQCIIESGKFTVNISYQIGYSALLLSDMFSVCWFSTKLNTYVGEAFYSTFWYSMSLDIQKDICMLIMRSQNPPKMTSGKIIVLNLHAFMLFVRNIYSLLTLFQQLEFKGP